ncbi:MAG: YrdB family protein [Anaerolineales bacterium]
MAYHPINLTLRFLLELAALVAVGAWGWQQREDGLRFALAIGLPLLLAIAWGVFAVPGDPSRSGKAPMPVPGWLRLVFELAFFALAVWALYDLAYILPAWGLGILVVLHYLASYDRIRWLLAR